MFISILFIICSSCTNNKYFVKEKILSIETIEEIKVGNCDSILNAMQYELDDVKIDGEHLITYAVRNKLYRLLEILVNKKCDIDVGDDNAITPLMLVCDTGDEMALI